MSKQYSTHAQISFIKSIFRIVGFFTLLFSTVFAVSILVVAELIGIAEEMFE